MATKTYLALDTEMFWDEHLYEAHRAVDRTSDRRATAVKRIMAASVLEFSIDDEGRIENSSTDAAMIRFTAVARRSDVRSTARWAS